MPDTERTRPAAVPATRLPAAPSLAAVAAVLLAAVLLAATLLGCGLARATPSPVIDGWPVGPALGCTPDDRCPELLAAARAGFEERDPGHPAIEAMVLHREGTEVDPTTGATILRARSGGPVHVAVFTLADGTVRALGVGFPGISREPVVLGAAP
jgi:hypothetical protein